MPHDFSIQLEHGTVDGLMNIMMPDLRYPDETVGYLGRVVVQLHMEVAATQRNQHWINNAALIALEEAFKEQIGPGKLSLTWRGESLTQAEIWWTTVPPSDRVGG